MPTTVRVVSDAERRARLGIRHGLVPDPRGGDPDARGGGPGGVLAAAESVVGLHATEPASVYLSAWARGGASRSDVDDALYRDRTVVRQLAMRRTVFAVPVDLFPAVRGSAAARVAAQQTGLLARSVVAAGVTDDGPRWVAQACDEVLARLTVAPAGTRQLRQELPILAVRLPRPEAPQTPPAPVAARVLTVLAASGRIVRGDNEGGWTTSRPIWSPVTAWLSGPTAPLSEAEGYAELVRRWLWANGPGTEADLVWWLGATKAAVRRALVDTGAVAVTLADGSPAWLRPDDLDTVRAPTPWAALLPALDPTTMGWRGRGFHVAAATAAAVYDRAGNGLPTAWWNGRIVGGWAQQADGRVVLLPRETLPRTATTALQHRARQLTERLDGQVLRTTFHRPLDADR